MISQIACTSFPNLIDLCVSDFDLERESPLNGKCSLFVTVLGAPPDSGNATLFEDYATARWQEILSGPGEGIVSFLRKEQLVFADFVLFSCCFEAAQIKTDIHSYASIDSERLYASLYPA